VDRAHEERRRSAAELPSVRADLAVELEGEHLRAPRAVDDLVRKARWNDDDIAAGAARAATAAVLFRDLASRDEGDQRRLVRMQRLAQPGRVARFDESHDRA